MTKLPIRQGDVLLIPAKLPRSATEQQGWDRIVALGEATGHAHRVDAPASEATLLTTEDNRRFLRIVSGATLVHEEHAAVAIPAGIWELPTQVEYTPAQLLRVTD